MAGRRHLGTHSTKADSPRSASKIGFLLAEASEVGPRVGALPAILGPCPQRFQLIGLAPAEHMQKKSTLHLGCLSQLGASTANTDESWTMPALSSPTAIFCDL